MADNVELNAGSGGATLACASLSFSGDTSVVQIVGCGILSGSEGSWTLSQVVGGAGAVTAGVQRVTLASDDPAVTDLAAIEVLLTAANVDHAANEVLLTTIAGDTTSIDGKITACNTGAVVISSGTITAITDITNTVTVDNGGTFAVQVDGAALTALQLIDDAVYTDGTGTPSKGLAVMGTDGTNPQILSTNATGHVNIADGGNTITVDGTVTVQDGGGAITVDNAGTFAVQSTLQAGSAIAGKVYITDGTDDATVRDVTGAKALDVAIVDGSGSQITSFGGGTQYQEDDVAAANPTGTMPVLVRQDTPAGLVGTDGDVVAQRATNYGAAYVQVLDSSGNFVNTFGGSGGTAIADDAAFTIGTTQGTPAMGLRDDSQDQVDDHDAGVLRMTARRVLYVTHETPNGDSMVDDTNDALQVNVVAGSASGTEYTEDAAAPANPQGPAIVAERDDALGGLTPAEGDWTHLYCNANGALWTAVNGTVTVDCNSSDVTLDNGFASVTGGGVEASALRVTMANDSTGVLSVDDNNSSLTVDNAALSVTGAGTETGALRVTIANNSTGLISVDDGGSTLTVDGPAAENAAATGSPVLTAGRYDSSERTTDNGDATTLATSAQGWMMVGNQSSYLFDGATRCEIKRVSGVAASGTTAMVAAVADKKIRILALALFATSSTVTNVYVATTTDTDVLGNSGNPIPLATDADGDNSAGFVLPYNQAGWTQTSTANEALNLILSAAQDVIYALTYIEVA